jgi:hypothetical protein
MKSHTETESPLFYPRKSNHLLFGLLLLALSSYSAGSVAANYYVAPWGNDANPGSNDRPWRTITRAANTVSAGDAAIIRGGTYYERVVAKNSGGTGNYITYQAYPNETVTIDGSGIYVPYWAGLFDVSQKSNIKIIGLRVVNSQQVGIFGQNPNNIIVSKCYTHNTVSSGIGMHFGSNITVDGNEIVQANTTGNQENLTLESIINFQVSNNHVHDGGYSSVGGEGIDVKVNSRNGKVFGNRVHNLNREGIYLDSGPGWLTNVEVYNNTLYSNRTTGIQIGNEDGGYLENVRIYNNIAYNNEWSGINVWGGGNWGKSHGMKDVYIINNTIYKNGWTGWGTGITSDNTQSYNMVIRNNIVSQNTGLQIALQGGIQPGRYIVENNLIDNSNRGWRLQGGGETLGSRVIQAVPNFVNAGAGNFRLQADSRAIRAGLNAATPGFDFAYKSRYTGYNVDIGAFQF